MPDSITAGSCCQHIRIRLELLDIRGPEVENKQQA